MRNTPRTANTTNKLCALKRDNLDRRGYWILVTENNVTICKQKRGEEPTQEISIPKSILNHFVHWYQTGQTKARKGAPQ